ncbi:hypothetical protein GGF37_006341, partial [Kickxella alabastrina]
MTSDSTEPIVTAPIPAVEADLKPKPAPAVETEPKTKSVPTTPMSWTRKATRPFSSPSVYAPTLPYECGGAREYNSYILYGLALGIPYLLKRLLSLSLGSYLVLTAILALPIGALSLVAHSWIVSTPTEQICALPNEPLEKYITILEKELKAKYHGGKKIPMEEFFENYFDGNIDLTGDALEIFEKRYDWAFFPITLNVAKFFFTQWIPELIWHSKKQDETQVRDHYDRGDDFYAAFLGDRMVYTSGLIGDETRRETLEELQDNKMRD